MTSPLDLSRSELRSLVTKSARGAGRSWGLAEDAGWAADWLARRGLPAAQWALDWLSTPNPRQSRTAAQGPVPGRGRDRADPVALGLALDEALSEGGAELPWQALPLPDAVAAPGYLLPFLHRIALRRGAVAISGPVGQAVALTPQGAPVFGPAWPAFCDPAAAVSGWTLGPAAPDGLAASSRADADAGAVPARRPLVGAEALAALEGLALHTTVPPSDASRRDAGATTPDDD